MADLELGQPLRVLLFIGSLRPGGGPRRCGLLANGLVARGHSVGLLVMEREDLDLAAMLEPAIEVHPLCGRWDRRWTRASRIHHAITAFRPAVYHAFLTCQGAWQARLARVPAVIASFGTDPRGYAGGFDVRGDRRLLPFVHRLTANSAGVRDGYAAALGCPPGRLTVIENGIEAGSIPCRDAALRREVRDSLGLAPEQFVWISVTRCESYKGVDTLLDACAERPADAPVLIVGQGSLQQALRRRAGEQGLADRCRFLGRRDDVPRLLQAADAFVLPSRLEGMPNAILEAMAAGLPVVGTDVAGTRELIVGGETGVLVAPDDPAALAVAMGGLQADPARGAAWGLAGRRRVEAEYSLDRMVRRYEALYHELLSARARD